MPARMSAWAIYDVFATRDEPVFIGVVSEASGRCSARVFGLDALGADEGLRRNNDRVAARGRILPEVRAVLAGMTLAAIEARLEGSGLPFAPIRRPEDLFEDPHLLAGGLEEVELPGGGMTHLPVLPVTFAGARTGRRARLP